MKFRHAAAAAAAAALACVPATSASAAAQLTLSKSTGFKVGETINVVSLTGLKANLTQVYIAQCKASVTGPTDCELSGALSGNADASGKWKPAKGTSIKLVKAINGTDCTSKAGACIIGVTSLTNPGAVLARVPMTFGGGSTTPNSNSNNGSNNGSTNDDDTPPATTDGNTSLPHTGSPDGVPTFALAASALVLTGVAALFLVPRRRRA